MIRVCLVGLGKTGREIAGHLLRQDEIRLVSVICSSGSDKVGKDVGQIIGCAETGIIIDSANNLEEVIFKTKPDVVVDFSKPDATIRNARVFSKMRINIVVGTTGFSKLGLKKLLVLTRKYHNSVVYAPNITLGVNVLMLFSNLAANILSDYDFHITEIHHKHKKDSPSGTALKIAKEIEKGIKSAQPDIQNIDVGIEAVRAGGVVGRHQVMIIGENDKIEIAHESFSRKAFALGAVKAIKFVYEKTGFYEMNDVIDLKKVLSDYLDKESSGFSRKFISRRLDLEKSQESLA